MRNQQLSVLKGIGIILMVIGHSACPALLHNFIYLFHMALFYFAAGYFFRESSIDHKWEFVKKRIKGLYIPFVKYELIFIILHNLFFNCNIYNDKYGFMGNVSNLYTFSDILSKIFHTFIFGAGEQLLGAYWFLFSLFCCSLLFLFIYWGMSKIFYLNKLKAVTICVLLVYVVGTIVSYYLKIEFPRGSQRELLVCPIFFLGFLFNRFQSKIYYSWWATLFSVFLLLLATQFGKVSIGSSQIGDPLSFIIVSSLGCYMTMSISFFLIRYNLISNIFSYIGEHTLEILTYHFLMFKIINLLKIKYYDWDITRLAEFPAIRENNTYWWIAYTIVGISFPLLLSYSIETIRIKCFNK